MIGSVVAALVLFGQASPSPGRYEVEERLKSLDQAWMTNTDKTRRMAAVPKITSAVSSFLNGKSSEVCQALDEATASLEGRQPNPADAISLRFDPPFVEPKFPARLRLTWAYQPKSVNVVRVAVGRQNISAAPGRGLTIEVRPEQINPEILQNPEVGYLLPVRLGSQERNVFLSIIKRPKDRLNALKDTKQPEALALVQFLKKIFDDPDSIESDIPIIQYLFTAELLDEGRLRLDRADNLPFVKFKDTVFRATFPRQVRGPLTVVIALHGAGGSENMFFEAYGRGIAVTEAARRNWAFVSPRTSESAVEDVIDWIKTRRKQPIDRIFIMGHSKGGAYALKTGTMNPKPSGIALFAPDSGSVPDALNGVPVFLAVGRQDLQGAASRELAQQISGRKSCVFEELDPCEHMMIVGDSVPAAYRFFDANSAR